MNFFFVVDGILLGRADKTNLHRIISAGPGYPACMFLHDDDSLESFVMWCLRLTSSHPRRKPDARLNPSRILFTNREKEIADDGCVRWDRVDGFFTNGLD
jgi:hypothetical protein